MKYVFKKNIYSIIIPILDTLGYVIFFPFKLFKKQTPLDPKKILVVRLDHIGDFVCTTPIFKNIKKRFPEAKITVLVNAVSKELAYRDPNIDKVITYSTFYLARGDGSSSLKGLSRVIKDIRNIGFDLGIEPRGDLLSILIMWLGRVKYRAGYGITGGGFLLNREAKYDKNIHVIDRNLALLKILNIPSEDTTPSVYFNDKDVKAVEDIIKDKKGIVLHPFAGAKAKEWSSDNFQKVIDKLTADGKAVLLAGSSGDKGNFRNVIDMRGRLNLPQLAYLIKSAGFFIGLDSGPANIAAALNVPSVIICSGTNLPSLWIPNSRNVKFVYKDVECRPCELKVCRKEKHECMDTIKPEEVIKSIKEIDEGIF